MSKMSEVVEVSWLGLSGEGLVSGREEVEIFSSKKLESNVRGVKKLTREEYLKGLKHIPVQEGVSDEKSLEQF